MKIKLITILMLLMLAGCVQPQGGPATKAELRTGTGGVSIDFIENAPPRSVIENNPLKIGVRVQNKGAYQSNPSIVISTE
ncbi:MAG: hypothetical protein ACQESF_06780, partial [Nanobdellota archaeon]